MEEFPIGIRKAEMKDAETITVFNTKMAMETEGRKLDWEAAISGVKGLLKDGHKGFYLVAETRGAPCRIVGQLMVTFEWSDWRSKNFWWLQSVYVEPAHRNGKVFSRLYRHLEEMARYRRDVAGLRLYVAKHNEGAKAAYENLGMSQAAYDMFEKEF